MEKGKVQLNGSKIKVNKDPRYFTAVMQLRFINDDIIGALRSAIRKDKQQTFISKEVKHKNGIDFYVSSNKFARRTSKELVERFGGKLDENERLFSFDRQTSKNIYRLNILIEFPTFAKHDVILFKDKAFIVNNIGKNVNLIDIDGWKSTIVEYKYLKDIKHLEKFETRVVKLFPQLCIFDENNEMVLPKNTPKKELKVGEKAKAIKHKGYWFVG